MDENEAPEWAIKALQTGLDDLRAKLPVIGRRRAYYRGDHPRVWVTDRLRELFDQIADELGIENWCELAIDTPLSRLEIDSFTGDGAEVAIQRWDDLGMDRYQADLFLDVLVTGEGYVSLWTDGSNYEADVNEPETIAWGPQRRAGDPPSWVVKVWPDDVSGYWRATVWDAAEAVRFVGPRIERDFRGLCVMPEYSKRFELDPEEPGGLHGFSAPPVIRFDLGRGKQPIIETIRRPQDRLNKLQADRMVIAEYNAWPQKVFLTAQQIEDGALDSRPDKALVLDPGERETPTSMHQFQAADIAKLDASIDRERDTIFTMAKLPRHLNVAHGGSPASGKAVAADEGPFVESVRNIQKRLGACFADFFELMGIDVEPRWTPAETKDPSSEAATVKQMTDAGMPLETALAHYAGWTQEELDEMTALKDQQAQEAMEMFQQQQPDPNAADGETTPPPAQ